MSLEMWVVVVGLVVVVVVLILRVVGDVLSSRIENLHMD